MKIKFAMLAYICICLSACSNFYEQYYEKYSDYNIINERPKSWFPRDIIFKDAYNLRSVSCLDSLSSFGEFNYLEQQLYDSVFRSNKVNYIPLEIYKQKIEHNRKNMPQWFHEPGNDLNSKPEIILINRFYISRDRLNKRISFLLCY